MVVVVVLCCMRSRAEDQGMGVFILGSSQVVSVSGELCTVCMCVQGCGMAWPGFETYGIFDDE